MSQGEWFTTYLQYENLRDLLNVVILHVAVFYGYNTDALLYKI